MTFQWLVLSCPHQVEVDFFKEEKYQLDNHYNVHKTIIKTNISYFKKKNRNFFKIVEQNYEFLNGSLI